MSIARRSPWRAGLGFALPIVAIAAFLIVPGSEDGKLFALLRGICAQRPDHSIVARSSQMALEARMYGIFAGFSFTVALVWILGGWRRTRLPQGLRLALLMALVGLMALDGLNAFFFDLQLGALYRPRTDLRLISGLLCGLSMAAFIAPVISEVLWQDTIDAEFFGSWTEVALALGLLAIVAGVSLVGIVPSLALSIMAGLSVLISFWLVNVHFAVLAWDGRLSATNVLQLDRYVLVGFVLSAAELGGLSLLRVFSESVLHVQWVV